MAYPANVTFEHQKKSSRLWALLTIIHIKTVLLLPHIIVLIALHLIAAICLFLGIFATLLFGEYPRSFEAVIKTAFRYQWRINSYLMCLTDKYPPLYWGE